MIFCSFNLLSFLQQCFLMFFRDFSPPFYHHLIMLVIGVCGPHRDHFLRTESNDTLNAPWSDEYAGKTVG